MTLPKQLVLMSPRPWPNKPKTQFLVLSAQGYLKESYPKQKRPQFNKAKEYFDIAKKLSDSESKKKRQLLCYNDPSDKMEDGNLRICSPLSLFLAGIRHGYYNEKNGHMVASQIYRNAKRLYCWLEVFDWICALIADCLTCQNNKHRPKH